MAGDWMKVEEATPDKPEIAILARRLGVSIGDAFLNWFRLYRWAGRVTGDPGFVRLLSAADADQLSGAMPGTCAGLASSEVGWIEARSDGLMFVNWDRHNSKSAKARALDSISKRHRRANDAENVRALSGSQPDESRTRREETRGELRSSNDDRKTIGSAAPSGGVAEDRSSQSSSHSSKKILAGEAEEPLDLSGMDWGRVVAMAEAAARRVPPRTTDDRRAWLRFGVLAELTYGEVWLVESAEAVVCAKETRGTRQSHFVGVLKTKALEGHGIDEATFKAMLRRIEIPADVWKSGVLEIRK